MTTDQDKFREWTRDDLDAYLSARYVTFDELVSTTGIDAETLEILIETGCMPGPSYELRRRDEMVAYVNGDPDTISLRTLERYFAKDVIAWVKQIAPRLQNSSHQSLALELKDELKAAFHEGLSTHGAADIGYRGFIGPDGKIDEVGFAAHFEDHVWLHWCEGTWGICVNGSQDMGNIARKAIAVQRLKLLTEDGTKESYTPEEAEHVRAAIAEYEAIVPPFSPHDHDITSRARLVEAVCEKVKYEPGRVDQT